jgi:hypothetical protein
MDSKTKAFFIVIILCVGLGLNFSLCSKNKQDWFNWFRSKLASITSSKTAKVIVKKKIMAVPLNLASAYSGIESKMLSDVVTLFLALVEDIGPIIASYRTGSVDRDEAIQKIKADLLLVVNNPLLYPTRSSKINALLKKDEFLQYMNDQDDLVQESCNQLIEEISAIDYATTKKTADKVIDLRLATLKAMVYGQSLPNQLKTLEAWLKQPIHFDVPQMQAYLSLYFRIKNKQNVEGKLTIEEKTSRPLWGTDEERVTVTEPSVD